MGSLESVHHLNQSVAIRNMVSIGKLDLTYIPANMSTAGQEAINRFLTNLWIYEQVLQPAETLLVFQTDSMLCANSPISLNDLADYDWVGAPWNPQGKGGGNGGLSIRKVSAIIDVLRHQVRADNSDPEDVWLSERLMSRPNARMANGSQEIAFSGEINSGELEDVWDGHSPKKPNYHGYIKGIDDWREGFYEPAGYHTGGGGETLHPAIWGSPELRKHLFSYCPEMKMTLNMDAAYYVPGSCNGKWRRDLNDDTAEVDLVGDEEIEEWGPEWEKYTRRGVDEQGYPYLPSNLSPW